jgi:hypothetical protein
MKLTAALLAILVPTAIYAQENAAGNTPPATVAAHAAPRDMPPTLHVSADVRTQFPGTNFGQVTCDEEGNVYARKYDTTGNPPKFMRAPVQKIKVDGRLSESFGVGDALLDAVVNGFFAASDGKVYLLAWAQATGHPGYSAYVVKFAADGSMESKIQIDGEQRFLPAHIAVFKSGEILISGRDRYTPFTGVFTPSGKLIRQISEPEDEELRKRAEAADPDVLAYSNVGNDAVDLGGVAGGSDGNVYLMRRTNPALIYVISARGKVVRKLQINTEDSLMLPAGLQSFPGGLAVLFASREGGKARVLRVVDLEGNPVATYQIENGLRLGDLGCYAPPTFTFLRAAEDDVHGFMYLSKVEPR